MYKIFFNYQLCICWLSKSYGRICIKNNLLKGYNCTILFLMYLVGDLRLYVVAVYIQTSVHSGPCPCVLRVSLVYGGQLSTSSSYP